MTRNELMGRRTTLGISLALAVAALGGCRDHIAAPTQGFLEIRTGSVAGVEVFLDGVSRGVVTRVGPLDAGIYTVSVAKDGYSVVTGFPTEVYVDVPAGGTGLAEFVLELFGPGAIQVTGIDEILGTGVTGAQILLDTGTGLVDTGQRTPATVGEVPPGPASVVLRRSGFQDSDPIDVTVVKFETTDLEVPLGPPRAVLAEMFTYIWCPNCPRSSQRLEEMQEAAPERVYVVEWHIDWRLPLYDARWDDRQSYYGAISGYPAVLFQGGTDPAHVPAVLIGSLDSELNQYEPRTAEYLARCGNECSLAIKVLGSVTASSADADVRVLYRGGALPGGLVLSVLVTENHVVTGGNQPYFSYVPRDIDETPVAFSTAGEISRFERSFPVGSWDAAQLHVVAWVQSSVTHEVLAVGGF